MINIDKTDSLYKYLTALGAKDVDGLYRELAENGRYKRKDVENYFNSFFRPSLTTDLEDSDIEPILDYYLDIKKQKRPTKQAYSNAVKDYSATKSKASRDVIYHYYLLEVLYMCINYKSLHKDVDLQDLVQVANVGLLTAIQKFKPDAKISLKSYINFWVRDKIKKEFEEKNNG